MNVFLCRVSSYCILTASRQFFMFQICRHHLDMRIHISISTKCNLLRLCRYIVIKISIWIDSYYNRSKFLFIDLSFFLVCLEVISYYQFLRQKLSNFWSLDLSLNCHERYPNICKHLEKFSIALIKVKLT